VGAPVFFSPRHRTVAGLILVLDGPIKQRKPSQESRSNYITCRLFLHLEAMRRSTAGIGLSHKYKSKLRGSKTRSPAAGF
jgi:hypothetical protein